MIGKLKKGSSFGGCIRYVTGKDEAKIIASDGVLLGTNAEITQSFELQRQLNPRIKKPVGHIALSFKPDDKPRLTDEFMAKIALEYMRMMGIKNGVATTIHCEVLQSAPLWVVGVECLCTIAILQVCALLELVIANLAYIVVAERLITVNLFKLTTEVVRIGNLLLIRINHLQQTVVAVVSPLCDVCCNRLVRHNHRAAGLGDFAHLAIEVFNDTCSILTEHQSADTVLRGVATTIIILYIILWMVRVIDTCQTQIVVIVGDELAFLRKVSCLLGKHIAESIISETCDAACRMVHLCATVAHVVSRGRYIALRVGDTNKALYAVVFDTCKWKMFQRNGGNIH